MECFAGGSAVLMNKGKNYTVPSLLRPLGNVAGNSFGGTGFRDGNQLSGNWIRDWGTTVEFRRGKRAGFYPRRVAGFSRPARTLHCFERQVSGSLRKHSTSKYCATNYTGEKREIAPKEALHKRSKVGCSLRCLQLFIYFVKTV